MTLTLLNNRYQVLRVLGSGGFGETFLAEDTQMPSSRRCVIKQLKPVANNPQVYQLIQQRFQQEAAILEELGDRSNQIPKLYAYFVENGQFYLVQEYIEGNTLTQIIKQQGLLSESAVKDILINILPVLEFVHSKRIVHRDIKPDNIILRFADSKPILIDFGAVKVSMGTIMTASGNSSQSIVIGTPGFMPMEQSVGRPVFSSDLYSLALTAIYLLTGKLPSEFPTDHGTGDILWRNAVPNTSADFAVVLDKAIQQSPRDRYLSARDMLAALQTPAAPTVPIIAPTIITTPTPPVSPGYAEIPTVAASPAPQYQPPTPPPSPLPYPNPPLPTSQGLGTWQQGVIIGGAIGIVVVGGLWLVQGKLSNQPQPVASVSPSSSPSVSPQITDTEISSGNSSTKTNTDTSSGNSSTKTNTDTPVVKPTTKAVIPVQTNTPIPSPQTTENPADTIEVLTEAEAKNLINNWLQAKKVMFAPPYNSQPAEELTTGKQYQQVAGYNGSINSLKTDGHYYKYGLQQIDSVDDFFVEGNEAIIQVKVTEDRKLFDRNGNILPKETDFKTRTVRYELELVDQRWKISATEIITK